MLERTDTPVSEYIFKLKKGDLELELKSDDARFIEMQMDTWRNMLLTQAGSYPNPGHHLP